jgi:hypothetical protein
MGSTFGRRALPGGEIQGRINFSPSRILDLSFGGALMQTSEWLGLGQRCTLRLTEPAVQIPAVVVRCRLVRIDPTEGRAVYEAGLSFDAPPALRLQLAGLVATMARDHVETPATVAY